MLDRKAFGRKKCISSVFKLSKKKKRLIRLVNGSGFHSREFNCMRNKGLFYTKRTMNYWSSLTEDNCVGTSFPGRIAANTAVFI